MATIVNNPAPVERDSSGTGFLLGVVLLIVFAILFLYYGLPYLRNSFSGPQISVPGKIDVNVHTPAK